jgi:D-3-phosphoglycerate dehydrogenase
MTEVLRRADYLSLHMPLTEDTCHIIDARAIQQMKPGAVIINVSRGGLLDEDAVADAVESGQLAGAGLDVTEIEPLPPDNRLLSVAGVIVTPHVAWLSDGARQELQRKAADEVVRVFIGSRPRNQVNTIH